MTSLTMTPVDPNERSEESEAVRIGDVLRLALSYDNQTGFQISDFRKKTPKFHLRRATSASRFSV